MKKTTDNINLVTEAVYRYKIAFANAALKSGATARYLSQHSIIWGARGGFTEAYWLGVCAGLSIEWIKARVAGTDLLDRLESTRTQVMSVGANALGPDVTALSTSVNKSHQSQNKIASALAGSCVPVGAPVELKYGFDSLKMTRGRYYYFSTGSHAMAGYCEGSKNRFYDPNVGEVQGISTPALAKYFKDTVEATFLAQNLDPRGAATKTITVLALNPVRP